MANLWAISTGACVPQIARRAVNTTRSNNEATVVPASKLAELDLAAFI